MEVDVWMYLFTYLFPYYDPTYHTIILRLGFDTVMLLELNYELLRALESIKGDNYKTIHMIS